MNIGRRAAEKILLPALVLAVWALAAPAMAKVSARLSHSPVNLNEAFELVVEYTGEAGGAPDLSGVKKDFDVVSQGTSQSIRVVNGQVSRRSEVRLTLMAREPGEYTIPGIEMGGERSAPVRVQVLEPSEEEKARTSDKVFLEVSAEPQGPLVQGQILFTVRLYRAARLSSLELSNPETQGPYTVVERLGESREYEKTVKGVRYRVSELRYALFPQAPGVLTIEPVRFTAFELEAGRGGFNPFGYSAAPQGKRVSARSEPVELRVKPIPANAPTKPWLPATNLQLAEAWPEQDPEFRVGQPITRTLMILAEGLPAAKLPALEPDYPEGLKTYSENATLENRPSAQGLTGVRQERITIVPTREGRFRLPTVAVEWWNTEKSRAEEAQLPAQTIRVLPPLPASAGRSQPRPAAPQQQFPLVSPPSPPWTSMEEPPLEAEPGVITATSDNRGEGPSWLAWLTLALGIGWLATAAAWWAAARRAGSSRRQAAPIGTRRPGREEPLPPVLQALEDACRDGDRHAAQEALLAWGRETWPGEPITSLGAVADLTPPPLSEEIRALDRALYGAQGASWNCRSLWEALHAYRRPAGTEHRNAGDAMLTPLNPPT